jgi:hypothetical protein
MQNVGERVADMLVGGDGSGPIKVAAPVFDDVDVENSPLPLPAPPVVFDRMAPPKKSTPSRARKSPLKKRSAKSPPIKLEPQRDLPFRSSRGHKQGFYSESNLQSLAWNGTGSSRDPITLD